MAAQFYLYHGNDPILVQRVASEWERRYTKKFPDVPVVTIDGREMNGEALVREVKNRAGSQSLFGEQVLIRVTAVSATEQGKRVTTSKEIVSWLRTALGTFDGMILFTEYQLFDTAHPLRQYLEEIAKEGKAKVQQFDAPDDASIIRDEIAALEVRLRFSPAAKREMLVGMRNFDQEQRQEVRANSSAVLYYDARRSVAASVLKSLAAMSDGDVSPEVVKELWSTYGVISPFVVLRQIERPDRTSGEVVQNWLRMSDDSDIFGLYELIRRTAVRMVSPRKEYLLQLMAEVEIIVKNGLLAHEIILPLLIERLLQFDQTGKQESLAAYRSLWLGSL
jgi:hypothetical protein